jgi:hypothetical protein
MITSINSKKDFFQQNKIGYITTGLEFTGSDPETQSGYQHGLINVSVPELSYSQEPFKSLMEHLNIFFENNKKIFAGNAEIGKPVITYCYSCKELIVIGSNGNLNCPKCALTLLL